MTIKRRDLLKALGGITAAAPFVGLMAGCPLDDDDDSAPDGDDDDVAAACTGESAGTSDSHGHSVVIPADLLLAAIAERLDLVVDTEGGDHAHAVTLTLTEMEELRDSCQVTVDSDDSHAHTWDIRKS